MRIDVFKSFDGVVYYGDVPQSFDAPESLVEKCCFDSSKYWPLISGFIDQMNDECGTTLDIGDVDFLDVPKCRALAKMLESFETPDNPDLALYFADLARCANLAIEYGTGIVVEM